VSSAVHLRFDIAASSLPDEVKARLLASNDQRITGAGVIVIKAQTHRRQDMNRADALQRLQEMVDKLAAPPRPRKPTKPSYGIEDRCLEGKGRRSEVRRCAATRWSSRPGAQEGARSPSPSPGSPDR
jgi:ribosome-associated protein